MSHQTTILEIESLTHDVRRFVVEKPEEYEFTPGQATGVAVESRGWRREDRPFTFTSLNRDPALEFTIKIYPERDGVTDKLGELEVGDSLVIDEPWGAIRYRGPGTFIAGGAGITPFIAILRDLHAKDEIEGNRLLFSNHHRRDVILRGELKRLLGDDCRFTLTANDGSLEEDELATRQGGYLQGRIDEQMLSREVDSYDKPFYVCGPPEMVEDVTTALRTLGADEDAIVTEDL